MRSVISYEEEIETLHALLREAGMRNRLRELCEGAIYGFALVALGAVPFVIGTLFATHFGNTQPKHMHLYCSDGSTHCAIRRERDE